MSITENKYKPLLAALINSMDEGIISKSLDGTITSWSHGAYELFGYTESEAIGCNITLIIPENKLSEEKMILERISRGERIHNLETVRRAKDGSEKMVSVSIAPIFDDDGKVIGASKFARDISQQKLAEERQSILAAIVDSSDDAIVSKTLDGIITSWNKSAQKMFGYSEDEVIGKHISIIIPDERIEEETMIITSIRQGKKIDHFETVRLAKDKTERQISLTVSPVKNSSGQIIGASKIARDISLRIQAEKQRELYIQRLHELNQYKDEFMIMASHELKTPLTVILANLQILHHVMEDSPFSPQLKKTIVKSQKMADLISDLLDVSKIQSGKLELNISTFDLNMLVAEVISNLKATTAIHTFIFEEKGDCLVDADQYRIEQVLINIIGNAIKYAPDGGNIEVKTATKNGQALIEISDNGIGIPQDEAGHIFERFYRSRGKAKSFSGSGVGLFISMEIIKKHRGTISVRSVEGSGATFIISIPVGTRN